MGSLAGRPGGLLKTVERALQPILLLSLAVGAFGWLLQVREPLGFLVYAGLAAALAFLSRPFFARRAAGVLGGRLFLAALAVKMAASAARHWMIFGLYRGGDAGRYDRAGADIAAALRAGDFSVFELWRIGTPAMEFLTGALYSLLPPSREGAFLLCSLLAFFGSLFFLLAYRAAFPERPPGAYAAAVLFLPSILFWPASLGKDALVFFGLGMLAYGAALQWGRHEPRGFLWMLAGLAPVLLVRPHTAGVFAVAACVSFLWSLAGTGRRVALRLVSGLLLGALGYLVIQANTEFLFGADMDEVSPRDVAAFYEKRKEATLTGGGAVEIPAGRNVLAPAQALVTVLFRPFLWEASNLPMAVTALESLFVFGVILRRRRALAENLKATRKNMLLALGLFFSVALIALQSGTSNLGIIARQRVQFLPYLFLLFL